MAILIRANEIREPLDDSLLARHAKSFGERSGNTSGIGPEQTLLERKLTPASGSEVDLMLAGGHFDF
jgi:hypothetical protein